MSHLDKIFASFGIAVVLLIAALVLVVYLMESLLKWFEPRRMYLTDKIKQLYWKFKEKFNEK